MYALYLDGSGSHGGSPVFILAGIAVHEQDAYHLQQRFSGVLSGLPAGCDPSDYELHAAEIKSPTRGQYNRPNKPPSVWRAIPDTTRFSILHRGYEALASYSCVDPQYRCAFFGAVVERSYPDYYERAWEEVLHRFDEMLNREAHKTGEHQRGVVIHDRDITESRVQNWADKWRMMSGRIGVLTHMIDVPFFADSRASRLLQGADFAAFALWRYYGLPNADDRWIKQLWPHFDSDGGVMHGLVHVTKSHRFGRCKCPPCDSRRTAGSKEVPAAKGSA